VNHRHHSYDTVFQTAAKHLAKDRQTFAVSLDDDDEDNPAFLQMPDLDIQETWYPSLRSTLWVLSLVHTFVEVSIMLSYEVAAVDSFR
jgi:hypothetical protein